MGIDGVEVPISADEPIVVRAVPNFQKMFNVLGYLFSYFSSVGYVTLLTLWE